LYFFNPNITDKAEYEKRLSELVRLFKEMPLPRPVRIVPGPYCPEKFFCIAKGLENEPEKGARCVGCYGMRLSQTAQVANTGKFDFFATTLTLSPLKDSKVLNTIGARCEKELCTETQYLATDFKKKDGYKKSIELSRQYNLYRQNYCGCIFSQRDNKNIARTTPAI